MKFTVLGGAGFIGSKLIKTLRSKGFEVDAPSRMDWPSSGSNLGHVLYCAGLTADFRERPFDTMDAHVAKAAHVLEKTNWASFLYLSSTRIYTTTDTQETAEISVRPDDPNHLYNISKLAGETLCLAHPNPAARVVRLSNVVGPNASGTDTFVGALCREAARGGIVLRSDRTSEKDYVWIDDVVEMLPRVALDGHQRLYNLASGKQIAHWEWVDEISLTTKCKVAILPDTPLTSFPPISIARISEEFGFQPSSVLDRVNEILATSSTA